MSVFRRLAEERCRHSKPCIPCVPSDEGPASHQSEARIPERNSLTQNGRRLCVRCHRHSLSGNAFSEKGTPISVRAVHGKTGKASGRPQEEESDEDTFSVPERGGRFSSTASSFFQHIVDAVTAPASDAFPAFPTVSSRIPFSVILISPRSSSGTPPETDGYVEEEPTPVYYFFRFPKEKLRFSFTASFPTSFRNSIRCPHAITVPDMRFPSTKRQHPYNRIGRGGVRGPARTVQADTIGRTGGGAGGRIG